MTGEPPPHDPEASPPGGEIVPEPASRFARRSRSSGGKIAPESPADASRAHPSSGPRVWPRIVGVLVLLLGAGGAWLWQNPGTLQMLLPSPASHATPLTALEERVARLEQRPVAPDAGAAVTALSVRVDALEKRVGQGSQTDLRPLIARLDALEAQAVSPDLSPRAVSPGAGAELRLLLSRVDALEQHAAEHEVDPAKVAAISSRVEALSAHDPAATLAARLDDAEHQLTGLAAKQAGMEQSAGRTASLTRLDAAEIALAAGRPLGQIPDAPEALARFATTAPPTEASLRLAFPAAERAALKVSRPDTEGKPFLDRVLERLQDFRLITVREGDHVVIGNEAASILSHARTLLDAGDLNGAARTVASLTGPPAAAMAAWLGDARALIAAREALAALAGNG
jgi:hypothetical protein